jgi:glycosyltransferase involved in cell wall biosynthesis
MSIGARRRVTVRVLHLYRPRLPSTRAQAIQVLRTCHALAKADHEVTLIADRGEVPNALWDRMGLQPTPGLHVRLAPIRHPGLAGLWFRRELAQWWKGEPGIVLARDKRRLLNAIRAHGKQRHRILLETHELDSLRPNGALDAETFRIEEDCLNVSDGLVANCGGTLAAWKHHHQVNIPTQVCHNATHVKFSHDAEHAEGVLVLGSMRDTKGIDAVVKAGQALSTRFRWVGGTEKERKRHGNSVTLEAAVPHAAIEDILKQAAVLVLPLGNNPFSHRFTSPLKLWDYLATDRPIVAARTDAIDEICSHTSSHVFHYEPENIDSIQHAIHSALQAPPRTPFRRTWSTRAKELTQMMHAIS